MPSAGTVALVPVALRATDRIELRFGTPAPAFVGDWQRELRRLGVRGAPAWQHELTCTDDGEGVDADVVGRRLGTLGVVPETSGQRGLFGRGLRDVWLAQGPGGSKGCATAGLWSRGSSRARATSPTRSCTSVTSRPGAATSSTSRHPQRKSDGPPDHAAASGQRAPALPRRAARPASTGARGPGARGVARAAR